MRIKKFITIECPTKVFLDRKVEFIDLHLVSPFKETTIFPRILLPSGKFVFENIDTPADIVCEGSNINFAFVAVTIPANGHKVIRIRRDSKSHCLSSTKDSKSLIDMKYYSIQYNGQTSDGKSEFIYFHKPTGVSDTFYIDYAYYNSFQDTEKSDAVSGAYLFRPITSDQKPKLYSKVKSTKLTIGQNTAFLDLVGDEMKTILIFNNFNDLIRFESILSGIPYTKQGMEVVLRVKSKSIKNEGVFYTDSMGLEMQKRVKNQRPYWNWTIDEEVSVTTNDA